MSSEETKQLENEGVAVVGDESSEEKWVKSENVVEVGGRCFRRKKGGVIPAKRRRVKRMVWDSIIKFLSSLFKAPCQTSTSNPNN